MPSHPKQPDADLSPDKCRKFYVELPESEFICMAESASEAIFKFWLSRAEILATIDPQKWPYLDVHAFHVSVDYRIHSGDPEKAWECTAAGAYAILLTAVNSGRIAQWALAAVDFALVTIYGDDQWSDFTEEALRVPFSTSQSWGRVKHA